MNQAKFWKCWDEIFAPKLYQSGQVGKQLLKWYMSTEATPGSFVETEGEEREKGAVPVAPSFFFFFATSIRTVALVVYDKKGSK